MIYDSTGFTTTKNPFTLLQHQGKQENFDPLDAPAPALPNNYYAAASTATHQPQQLHKNVCYNNRSKRASLTLLLPALIEELQHSWLLFAQNPCLLQRLRKHDRSTPMCRRIDTDWEKIDSLFFMGRYFAVEHLSAPSFSQFYVKKGGRFSASDANVRVFFSSGDKEGNSPLRVYNGRRAAFSDQPLDPSLLQSLTRIGFPRS